MYHCIRGGKARLLFNPKFANSKLANDIPPGTTNSVISYRASRVESLWSDINNVFFRILVSPLYGAYIITHTLLGSRVSFSYTYSESGFISEDEYIINNDDTVIMTASIGDYT
jgi:hypothetical protein